jgi:cytochrome c556
MKGLSMKKLTLLALTLSTLCVATSASAQFAKPEDAIKYRKSALFVMGQNFGRVAAMATGKAEFNAKLAAESAANADFVAKMPWEGFVAGTDKGGDTRAKAEIWTDKAKFDDLAKKMQQEMHNLATVAKTGSLENIKTAFTAAAGTCKSCHDDFRAK